MKRSDLEEVLKIVEKETVRARALGGYSTEAESIMVQWEVLLKLTRHLVDSAPRSKNDPDSKA